MTFFNFYVVETFSKIDFLFQILHSSKALMFKLDQLYVNHKSHVSQPTINMYHTKVLKALKFLCSCDFSKMHDSHSSAFLFQLFSFNNYTLKLNSLSNNILFMLWNMILQL